MSHRDASECRPVSPSMQEPAWRELLARIDALGIAYGRELSFKLRPGRLLRERLLVGMQRDRLDAPALFALAAAMGMPAAAQQVLAPELARTNAVFFATEDDGPQRMFKVYLEFWDEVCARVHAGARTPQLLHLGVKWSSARPGHHEEAHYMCHPLLTVRDVLRRMRDVYPQSTAANAMALAQGIVREGVKRHPDAGLLYLEATEDGNPRRSFDVNLYKTGLRVAGVADALRQAAGHFGVAAAEFEPVLRDMAAMPLGHIAGGCDRRGAEFLSVYAEVAPLPPGRAG